MRIISSRADIDQYADETGPQGTDDASIRERFADLLWASRGREAPELGQDWEEFLGSDAVERLFVEAHK